MNYLAHLLLSGPDPDWRLGGLLGDFVKGPLRGERPPAIEAGIRLHRRIDAVSDAHPAYLTALQRLGPGWRRYGGIVLDIWFDHLLSRQWSAWHHESLDHFCDQCWRDFRARSRYIPPNAWRFMQRAEQFKLLQGYPDRAVITRSLERVGQRLRRPVPLEEAMPVLIAAEQPLQLDFNQLFSDLMLVARRFREDFSGFDNT
ncbi:ACP phosphodiesterase [Microbulbifer yueqingensis]|uniref:Acyl carrier protein phosphodiesterase n=1 Tax=Microbulbifer yueqingensis TaxID=658219 RepID=A0A1G9BH60_9GAMM|nr:ACP phosphodiesterase [Microbulbifer yueqingensis]SDK38858.1 Acyl carrier protein phosphodiesterase [Microbulbifer yueqingensis]